MDPGLQGGPRRLGVPRKAQGPCRPAVSLCAAAAEVAARRERVVWCAVGPEEERKCKQWSDVSNRKVACASASTTEECIALVLVGDYSTQWEHAALAGGAARSLAARRSRLGLGGAARG